MSHVSSEQWSNAHIAANDLLSELLNHMRDLGYNPSLHIGYDRVNLHVTIEDSLLEQHPEMQPMYDAYRKACQERNIALEQIQSAPKADLGFSAET